MDHKQKTPITMITFLGAVRTAQKKGMLREVWQIDAAMHFIGGKDGLTCVHRTADDDNYYFVQVDLAAIDGAQ